MRIFTDIRETVIFIIKTINEQFSEFAHLEMKRK